MRNYIHTCPYSQDKLNDWFIGNFRGRYLNKNLNTFRTKYFCTEECYNKYKANFVVEVYHGKPIYCVEIDGEKRYMPYFEANYYFNNIDDCKTRMNMKHVAVIW
jgi:hypothetical protein